MNGCRHRIARKKAGSSGLFHRAAVAASLLMAPLPAALAEPLAVELTQVSPGMDEQKHLYIVFQMTPESAKRFADFTARNVGHVMEVRIDGKVIMSPVLREPILNGQGQISNASWTVQQTKDMADRLAAGKSRIEFSLSSE